jgi:hypothetical protein
MNILSKYILLQNKISVVQECFAVAKLFNWEAISLFSQFIWTSDATLLEEN